MCKFIASYFQVCVEACPDKTVSFWAKANLPLPSQDANELLREMKPYCDPDKFIEEPDINKIKEMISSQACPAWIIKSSPFLGRCIPFLNFDGQNHTDTDIVFDANDFADTQSQSFTIKDLKEKVNILMEVLNVKTFGEKVLADLKQAWWIILVAVVLASFISFMWIILMRFVAAVMVWASILLSVGLLSKGLFLKTVHPNC